MSNDTALISPSQFCAFNREAWDALTPIQKYALANSGHFNRRADQLLPDDYEIALIVGARSWGKSAATAWEVNQLVDANPGCLVALCAQDELRTRTICAEWLIKTAAPWNRCELSGELLYWANGSVAHLYSPLEPSKCRGPSFHVVWASEIGFWPKNTGFQTYKNLKTACRVYPRRILVDTSPSYRSEVLAHLLALHEVDPVKHPMITGTMHSNIMLGRGYIESEHRSYASDVELRQEVYGDLVAQADHAIFQQSWFSANRIAPANLPRFDVKVIAADPNKAGSSSATSDKTGLSVCGRSADGTIYTLRDLSDRWDPEDFALAIANEHRDGASTLVVELNAAGAWLPAVLKPYLAAQNVALEDLPAGKPTPKWDPRKLYIRKLHWHRGASEGKLARLQSPAVAVRSGRVKFAGVFAELEAQACVFTGDGRGADDNLDAWAFAVTELLGVNSSATVVTGEHRQKEVDAINRINKELARSSAAAGKRDVFSGEIVETHVDRWHRGQRTGISGAAPRKARSLL